MTQLEREQRQRLEIQQQLIQELERELQTAHDLQMDLMPGQMPSIPGFRLAGRCVPFNHVGGDFFQFFRLSGGRVAIALADVTGHAMEAAIPLVMFNGSLESQMELGSPLEDLFGRLNRSLYRTLPDRTYVCLAMGELDPAIGTLRLANSGCPYPYHYKAASRELVELRIDAYPLGVRPETAYLALGIRLDPGDRVVFCSDGIVEAENPAGELFGFERTAETILAGCAQDLSATDLLERIFAAVQTFSKNAPQGDDRTLVVLEVERS